MKKISSKSKARVLRLLTPPTKKTGMDEAAPVGLTVRQLIHHQRRAALRSRASVILIEGGHLLSVDHLKRFGWDLCG